MKTAILSGIYAITPEEFDINTIVSQLQNAAHKFNLPIKYLQYRAKCKSMKQQIAEISKLKTICQENQIPLIINDNLDLALMTYADGVHLGGQDLDFKLAKQEVVNFFKQENEKLNKFIIGVSCYQNIKLARYRLKLGASYVAFGAAFISSNKPNCKTLSARQLNKIATLQTILRSQKIVLIGGITQINFMQLKNYANLIAMIDGVFLNNKRFSKT